MEPRERIIVALDVDNLDKARELVRRLAPHVGYFKVGLELLTSEGAPWVVHSLRVLGAKIFYDGKFMDIPNTVAGASRAVARLGVEMFNVHASGGVDMVRAAVENKGNSEVLVVTVLTSLSDVTCSVIYGASPSTRVTDFASMACLAGANGVICSPEELEALQDDKFKELYFVTPGIRPAWAVKGDQARIATPEGAIRAGADYLVIGRPITRPPSEIGTCVDAAKLIAEEIEKGLEGR